MNLYLEFMLMWAATVIVLSLTAVAAIIIVGVGEALSDKFGDKE